MTDHVDGSLSGDRSRHGIEPFSSNQGPNRVKEFAKKIEIAIVPMYYEAIKRIDLFIIGFALLKYLGALRAIATKPLSEIAIRSSVSLV
jgi:hypothetical protein